ncbi:hypothetical protein LSUE1_G008211 [Lachnellula suecica]|uniref:BTB domain-containing protein n=1 Tax=Lachnellula suecica TaxID=602035 RepID=A0A8T9BYE3_9HELO|nr:hypothetical protein LSUE1_G008211 [Lachnellula suecica]
MSWDTGAGLGGPLVDGLEDDNPNGDASQLEKPTKTGKRKTSHVLTDLCVSNGEKRNGLPRFSKPNEMVTFVIGTEPHQETFQVHKEHACHYSPVLNKAFTSEFIEGSTKIYKMEEEYPEAFRHFVQWMYKQKINNLMSNNKVSSGKTEEETTRLVDEQNQQTTDLINLWLLADILNIPQLQNTAMECLIYSGPPNARFIGSLSEDIYERSGPDSKIRQMMAEICAWGMSGSEVKECGAEWDKDFLVDVLALVKTEAEDRAADILKERVKPWNFWEEVETQKFTGS